MQHYRDRTEAGWRLAVASSLYDEVAELTDQEVCNQIDRFRCQQTALSALRAQAG